MRPEICFFFVFHAANGLVLVLHWLAVAEVVLLQAGCCFLYAAKALMINQANDVVV